VNKYENHYLLSSFHSVYTIYLTEKPALRRPSPLVLKPTTVDDGDVLSEMDDNDDVFTPSAGIGSNGADTDHLKGLALMEGLTTADSDDEPSTPRKVTLQYAIVCYYMQNKLIFTRPW
jgi:hypothetical protein